MPRFQTSEKLSAHMRTIRKTNTKPELAVRKLIHAMGYRFSKGSTASCFITFSRS